MIKLTVLQLKPCCVQISQLAIRESQDPGATRQLLKLTDELLAILNHQVEINPSVIDEKLAEYVFFPLYHIFRQMEQYPMPLVEDGVKCLNILIVNGWKSRISPKMVQQIASLLTFIIDGVPGSLKKRDIPEETVLEAFRAFTALLTTAGSSPVAASGLADPETIPALGHGVSVILDGIVNGVSAQIQGESIRALTALYMALRDHGALASFLPGVVSSLTKLLSTPNRYKVQVLTRCLEAVQVVFTRVLADLRTRSILKGDNAEDANDSDGKKVLSSSWLKDTTARVKISLSSMMKLRTHDAWEVRDALERLCVSLLDECHTTLSNCSDILVETAMVLQRDGEQSLTNTALTGMKARTSLKDLVSIYPELGDAVKLIAYNWMSSLPRIMQASDEDIKEKAVHNLTRGIEFIRSLDIESSMLDDSIASSLRDSIVSLVSAGKSQGSGHGANVQLLDDANLSVTASDEPPQYQAVLLAHEAQRRLRGEVMGLFRTIGSTSYQHSIATTLLEYVQESTSTNQVAAFWLCYEIIKAGAAASAEVNAFLDFTELTSPSDDMDALFNELYTFSVQVLDSHSNQDPDDWRMEAIALEVTAYAAQRAGESFRPELIDVLFPIATFLGSDNMDLQQHAIVTLNSISRSCNYHSVSDLIIDNVDYMVNSVSLRLNTLDISPASTQVLLMMIRLAGPQLIPFLDDVVESIFVALDNFHGYQKFVESLFSVLKELVDQASKADGRMLTDKERSAVNHKKVPLETPNLDSLLEFLDKRNERRARDAAEDEALERGGHPNVPWTSDNLDENENKDKQEEEGDAGPAREEEKQPNSPTYQLLNRIATLTQHYLTSPTPKLRRSLLELLTTASFILAADEDSYLPLVNAIWPVVVGRLRDPESFVVIEACFALEGICKAAGDFLSTRFKTEWWDWLGEWCRKAKKGAEGRPNRFKAGKGTNTSSNTEKEIMIPIRTASGLEIKLSTVETHQELTGGGLGQYASPAKIWDAITKLLTAIVSYVSVEDEMFDEILDLLADVMEKDADVRKALETINADAVWLVRYELGRVEWLPTPEMDGVTFPAMERF